MKILSCSQMQYIDFEIIHVFINSNDQISKPWFKNF